jgi:flagellar FliL protein
MLHIFIISNDVRVEKLIEFFQPFFKTKIRRASDFDHGLQEVFENRPSVVFIQSTIGNVSGETVARHIKSLLGSGSPRIVFMGEEGARTGRKAAWCDDWISINGSEQKLRRDFSKLLNEYYPVDWSEIAREMEKSASRQPDESAGSDSIKAPEKPGEIACADAQQASDTSLAPEEPKTITTEGTAGTQALADLPPVPEETELPFEIFPDDTKSYQDLSPTSNFSQREKRPSLTLRLGFLILFLLILSGGWFLFRKIQDNRHPVPAIQHPPANGAPQQGPSPSLPSSAPINVRELPSFLRNDWRDASYSASHPGWERYLSPEYDFRLFRENDSIKAIQVIARGNGQVPDTYLASVLREFGLPRPQSMGVPERKDGLLVQRITIQGKAELVLYKSDGDGRLKAFVLAFS